MVVETDIKKCQNRLEFIVWHNGVECPHCGELSPYRLSTRQKNTGHRYKCSSPLCHLKFSVVSGTIFNNSKIPLPMLLFAIEYLIEYPETPSTRLSHLLGVTQKSAYNLKKKITQYLNNGHNERNIHEHKHLLK